MNLTKVCIVQGDVITPWDNIIRWSDIMSKPDVNDWIRWVNENICLQLTTDNTITTGVKVRIATGMLNKLLSLSDEQKIRIHQNLTNNINSETNRLIDESLPF